MLKHLFWEEIYLDIITLDGPRNQSNVDLIRAEQQLKRSFAFDCIPFSHSVKENKDAPPTAGEVLLEKSKNILLHHRTERNSIVFNYLTYVIVLSLI